MIPQLERYYQMLRIRRAEEEIAKRYGQQQMRCPVHLSIGQEAAAVGVASAITREDYMVSTHRGHAHYLAKGGDLKALLSELYGKVTGCAKGQGGSMHLVDWSVGFVASTSIVGGTIPVGVGTAFSSVMKNENKVAIVCIGDAAIEEGVFHESANFAALHKLPVIFACENNLYSCYTALKDRQPHRPLTQLASGHGLKTLTLNGNDVEEVHRELGVVVSAVRMGEGPFFVEMTTYRHLEHCGPNNDDQLNYRDPEELKSWREEDPLQISKENLKQLKLWDESLDQEMQRKIAREVEEAMAFAIESPFPSQQELGAYIYAPN